MSKKPVTLSVSLPKKLHAKLRKAAKQVGWSTSHFCRWAVQRDLEKRGLK